MIKLKLKDLFGCVLVAIFFISIIFLATLPQRMLSEDDANEISSLQSEFSRNCDCQAYFIAQQGRNDRGDIQDRMYAEMSSGRPLWQINEDIRKILKKYPFVPERFFLKICNKVPQDN